MSVNFESLAATENTHAFEPESGEWRDLEPFDEVQLPTFPIDKLPPVLRDWVEAEAHATQTPPSVAAMLSLATCSATIARRVMVETGTGWQEGVNLYVAAVLPPGSRKSAVFSAAVKPLQEAEQALQDNAFEDVSTRQSERRQKERKLAKLEKIAVDKDDAKAAKRATQLAVELATTPEPVLPRLIVSDATNEKLTSMLSQQGGRMASMSAEGEVFDMMAGQYTGTPSFNVYLKGHTGETLTQDRMSRDGVHIERATLTCAYTVQPNVIESIAGNKSFRGRGLLGRFLYAFPKSLVGYRETGARAVSPEITEAYARSVEALAMDGTEATLKLTMEADELLEDWLREIELMLREGGELEAFADWGGKLAGATLRIAATIHCVSRESVYGEIECGTIADAIAISRFLIPHARHALQMMDVDDDQERNDALYLLRWIEAKNLQQFTKSDAYQHGRQRFKTSNDVHPALSELHQRGYIRQQPPPPPSRGRPPSPVFEVNPAISQEWNQ